MAYIPWSAIFLAIPTTFVPGLRRLGFVLLLWGYLTAFYIGQLDRFAVDSLVGLLLCGYAITQSKAYVRCAGHLLFVLLAFGLSLHWLPGFHNVKALGPIRFTPDAVPFTMYLNLDKPLIGVWVLAVVPWLRLSTSFWKTILAALGGLMATALVCLGAALILGTVAWAPKLPASSGIWLINNLLLVTFAEEALFRGYLQGGLQRLLQGWRWQSAIAIGTTAILFGASHAAGGWQWMALGTLAGIGYGITYRFGGLSAAIAAHFGLNVLHFFLFTYPMLQPG
ncbi:MULTISPECIES: CPBP family intramembrane glutamic endopeptidase [unclassified Cupriavidus]|uniref:CPBP family intramembrane glutamic endopeptidase n=1 Tax=unclassified Cupriavidus TaxID=2640874 RepID=UPI00136651D7|nr:type II CAAX endopeptidase family protein [Cupriavidus sp. SW-Y-13]MWL89293.1 CPBP family intramembrane metalloprotease [Cupriavidus sp. SW-Y-13]